MDMRRTASAHRPRKRFGQHFLVQPGIAARIVGTAELSPGAAVLEIGPGRGALTRPLLAVAGELFLVEIDRDLCRALGEELGENAGVHVIEGDVLDLDLPALLGAHAPVTVVANLPYNVSTPVLMRLLDTPELFRRLVLMLQHEVAARLCSPPGSKSYGALSVMAQLVAAPRIAFRVPPTAFSPRPAVDSAVVILDPHRPQPLDAAERQSVRRVVRTAFSRRRKQLANVVAGLAPDAAARLDAIGFDRRCRPETLSPADFLRLTRALGPAADAT